MGNASFCRSPSGMVAWISAPDAACHPGMLRQPAWGGENKKPFPLGNGVGESALSWLPGNGLSVRGEGIAFLLTEKSKGWLPPNSDFSPSVTQSHCLYTTLASSQ